MSSASENRVKFNRSNLKLIENRVNRGEFTKETYLYDTDSRLVVRVKPNLSYSDCAFCLYARVRVKGDAKSKIYKRNIIKVSDARNAELTLTELRRKVDRLYLDIQEGLDPLEVAKEKAAQEIVDDTLVEAKRSLRDMIYGSVISGSEERLSNGFIMERRPSDRYLIEIKYKCDSMLVDLMRQPLYSLSAEDIKTLYLKRVGKGKTQLDGAMRILRSIWNWAQAKYDESDLFIRNPVSRAMKQLGVYINRTNRRNVRLDEDEFKPYIRSVLGLREHDHSSAHRNGRDALLLMLFSGVRLHGTLSILVADINLQKLTFDIVKKGGEKATLPLNTITETIVKNRLRYLPRDNKYLYPGIAGRGYYRDTKSVRAIVKEETGIAVTNHDLRRTYKTIGTELHINSILVDELCSHAREGVDAHYVHPSMTSLREASQKIADYIVRKSETDIAGDLLSRW